MDSWNPCQVAQEVGALPYPSPHKGDIPATADGVFPCPVEETLPSMFAAGVYWLSAEVSKRNQNCVPLLRGSRV